MKLSVIVPTFNRQVLLERCVLSVLAQKVDGVELIVVDDASTDTTIELLENISRSDSKLKYFVQSVNKGVNAARNVGIKNATGDYVLFLDSDDYLINDSLALVLDAIKDINYSHFLFLVSDRENDRSLSNFDCDFSYSDWLQRRVKDDFTHVLRTNVLKKYLFFEEYRGFENLNWFRIFRETGRQRFVRSCICIRDRNVSDSLIRAISSQDEVRLFERQLANRHYIALYMNDYLDRAPSAFVVLLTKTILNGVRLKMYTENYQYLTLIRSLRPEIFPFLYLLNAFHSGGFLNIAFTARSFFQSLFKKSAAIS